MRLLFISLLFVCLQSCKETQKATSDEEKEEEVTITIDSLFDDIAFTQETLFDREQVGVASTEKCSLHRLPLFKKEGFRKQIHINNGPEFGWYLAVLEASELAPNPGPYVLSNRLFVEEGEHTEPYSTSYCPACRHLHEVSRERFFLLTEKEQKELFRQAKEQFGL